MPQTRGKHVRYGCGMPGETDFRQRAKITIMRNLAKRDGYDLAPGERSVKSTELAAEAEDMIQIVELLQRSFSWS